MSLSVMLYGMLVCWYKYEKRIWNMCVDINYKINAIPQKRVRIYMTIHNYSFTSNFSNASQKPSVYKPFQQTDYDHRKVCLCQ